MNKPLVDYKPHVREPRRSNQENQTGQTADARDRTGTYSTASLLNLWTAPPLRERESPSQTEAIARQA
jgi:hypothetical protein